MPTKTLAQRGAELALRKREKEASIDVTYVRGATSIGPFPAEPGGNLIEIESQEEFASNSTKPLDWIIARAHLRIDTMPIMPENGDQIWVEYHDKTKRRYDVLPINGDRCYHPMGPDETTYRVHTKLGELKLQ